ncbi:Uncharacterized protein conserved in cyanobacteria [Gloeomargarita lithophora Alchichica-D10]|uniref:Uncharacterized protein conserved in cyanobacteria n=1 Tax=Gloeomargarita lithophora Alchichica-D10 TaxID=1188229 RepID=A0A1J0AAJ3_9CYAN|nr:Uma2 family endonuclease [Gloeomargarita lithophora]APB32925.1 Uncharacterized protein conserved in cyanobacteria [Gloeomargarita lithophora Alchichica-D10]
MVISSVHKISDLILEQRVLLQDIPWDGYLKIHEAIGETRATRLVYDRGTLEISMPFETHEFFVRMIERLIVCLVSEMGQKLKTMGSSRLDYPNLDRGAEPDNAYYLANQPKVKGRRVNFMTDPPPDLVVEVDISPSKINKLALYSSMNIPEFWQFDGEKIKFYTLQKNAYEEVEISPSFPKLTKDIIYRFLDEAREDEIQAEVNLRTIIQEVMK